MDQIQQATNLLLDKLGPKQVLTDPESLYEASMDNMRYSRLPSARIRPEDEEAISLVLETANRFRVPLTVRGAGSATTGTTTPCEHGWVLDLSAWNKLHIDAASRMAFVQPGVTIKALDKAAARHGLMYAPDPGSREYATIGGSIATNAGGMRGGKYGVTRDYVLSLEGFLPSGEFVRWGANLKKFSAGYNIRDLWIGSEGTLGIITGAVMKLLPRPQARATCLAVFVSAESALTCAHEILLQGLTPSAMEFLDAETVGCTFSFWKKTDPAILDQLPGSLQKWIYKPQPPAVLLIEVDGTRSSVRQELRKVEKQAGKHAAEWNSALDEKDAEVLWKLRRSCSQAMFELGPRKLNEDVVVPFDCQLALIDFTNLLHEETGLPTPTFGHAADGNYHVHIMYDDKDPAAREKAQAGIKRLMEHVIELGGAISGEHGIGLAKSPFFSLQHSEAEIKAMQAIKASLDPNAILNPDKLWHPAKPWDFPREDVRMPWDH